MLCVCGIEIEKEIAVADRLSLTDDLNYCVTIIEEHLGKKFITHLDKLLENRNVFITMDMLNEKDFGQEREGNPNKVFGYIMEQRISVHPDMFHYIKVYAQIKTVLNYNVNHSLYINHINGFIIVDTNKLKYNSEVDVNSNPEDIGHLIGKGGSHIMQLRNEINTILKEFDIKERVKFVKAYKIKS